MLFRMSTGCQKDRKTNQQTDRLFSLVIKTKVFQNVNRMSKCQSDRQEDIQHARQTDRETEWQYNSMADSRAAKELALVPQSAWTTVHLLAKWHSGAKKCLKVRQVLETTNSKVWMLSTTLKTWQSEAKNCTIPHSACTMVHLVAQWQSGAKNYTCPHSAYTMIHLEAHSASTMVHLVTQ